MNKLTRYTSITLLLIVSIITSIVPVNASTGDFTFSSSSYDGYVWNSGTPYDTGVQQATTGSVSYADTILKVGQNTFSGNTTYRTILFFDATQLPQDLTITSANITFFAANKYITNDIDILFAPGNGISTPISTSDYYNAYANFNILSASSINTTDISLIDRTTSLSLNTTAISQISRTRLTSFIVRSNEDYAGVAPTGDSYIEMFSSERGSGFQPQLVISGSTGEIPYPTTITIDSIAVFNNYREVGDQLFTVMETVDYANPPGPPNVDSKDYFALQLLDSTQNVTAQVKIPDFGKRISSIYFTSANKVDWSNYYMRISGTNRFSIPPTNTVSMNATMQYGFVSGDTFRGWVLISAHSIEKYEVALSSVLVESYQNIDVLNEYGGAIFTNGITDIDAVRPDLFKSKLLKVIGVNSASIPTNAYQNTLSGNFGANNTAVFAAIGNDWGMDGGILSGFFWMVIMFIMIGAVSLTTGSWVGGTVVTLPVLFLGALFGIIPLAVIGVITFISGGLLLFGLARSIA